MATLGARGLFFGGSQKKRNSKKAFLAFSSSPKKKNLWQPIYSPFFCLKGRATGKIGPIFVFIICFRNNFIRLTNIVTCKLAFTLIHLVVREGDSGRAGGGRWGWPLGVG